MNLWLDDIRPMPPGYDFHARTAEEAIRQLAAGDVQRISFDHDLAAEHYAAPNAPKVAEPTGYVVACWIERAHHEGRLRMIPRWRVHSANPVGRARIQACMRAFAGHLEETKG